MSRVIATLIALVAALPVSARAAEGGLDRLPTLAEAATPAYPEVARSGGYGAEVALVLDLDVRGEVESATVSAARAVDRAGAPAPAPVLAAFVTAAVEAGRRLRFTPAEAEGQPVPVSLTYTFTFMAPAPQVPAPVPTATVAEAPPAPPAGQVSLQGEVRAAGTRRRLAGALVVVKQGEDAFETTADAEGAFRFYDLAPGPWSLVVDVPGFEPDRSEEELRAGEVLEVTVYLRRASDNPYDVVVEGQRPQREVTRRILSAEAATQVAGTMGDPVLALENLPGVARAGIGNGRPVRGSSPQDTRYYVEGLGILFDEHVGGFRSVLPSQMVERVDFYPGNFSARYGRGTGGVVDVKLKDLKPDQLHGALDVSLLDAGLYLEAPLGDEVAVAVAGRRSYIDAVLGAAIPDDGDLSLSVAPRWYDYQAIIQWRPNAQHDLRFFALGGDDAMTILFRSAADLDPEATTGSIGAQYNYQRLSVQHRYTSGGALSNDLRVGVGRDTGLTQVLGRFSLQFRFLNLSVRDEARWKVSEALTIIAGLDLRTEQAKYDVTSFRPPKEGEVVAVLPPADEFIHGVGQDTQTSVAGFVEAEWRLARALTVVPGARVDYFGLTRSAHFDPRLVVRYQLLDAWTFSAGVGLVHQAPELDEVIAPFGNPAVDPSRALHTSVGARWQPLDFFSADVTLFYKRLDHLVSRVDDADLYRNEGTGEVLGMEVYLRQELAFGLSGWLSYTLSQARRTDAGATSSRPFDYDQTHILTLVARYALPADWALGVRWRLVSGRPTTPFAGGVFVDERDGYEPIPGPTNSGRLPSFHMLDVRVDKRWTFDQWAFTAYLSVSNVYNRANAEDVEYSYDFRTKSNVAGLPLLPIVGVNAEF
ncbi:MAG: TonB-dependent receptor [Deltaproteobacteria bacterium]|nr:TonB-dependent receptor [Deltaproteobacteria bacterium]